MSEVGSTRTQTPRAPWWIMLITGVATVVLGIFLIFAPAETVVALVQILGIYWLITGVFSLVSLIVDVDRSHWVWKLFGGILGIVVGLFLLLLPLWAVGISVILLTSLVFIAATLAVAVGSIHLILVFTEKSWGHGILGVLSIIFGIILFLNPLIVVEALPFIFGALAILGGIGVIVLSFSNRKEPGMATSSGG
jgi:uncharacterized membrane protein HdeD (DUF308 family)